MSTVLTGGVLFALAGAAALLFKRRIEELFAFAISGVVLLLYVFGLAGRLVWGVYAVAALAAASFAYCLFQVLRRGGAQRLKSLLTPGALVFALLLAVVLFYYRNRLCDSHDEFSHWILEVKNMYLLSAIPNANPESTVHFRDYPPATALFSFLWMRLAGAYNEGDAFRANMVWTIATLLPVFRRTGWKQWASILPLAAVCWMLPLLFNTGAYNSIYVDVLLGAACAYPLTVYFTGERSARHQWLLCVPLLVLPLIKASGFGLGLLVSAVIAADWLMLPENRKSARKWRLPAALLLSCLLGKMSWNLFLRLNGMAGGPAVSLTQIASLFSTGIQPYQQSAWNAFWRKMIEPESWKEFAGQPFSVWLLALAASIAAFGLMRDKQKAARYRRALALLMLVLVIYALSTLGMYLFTFSAQEAAAAASCERYLSTALMMAFGVWAALLLDGFCTGKAGGAPVCIGLALLVLLCSNYDRLYVNTFRSQQFIEGAQASHQQREPSRAVLDSLNPETDKVYLLMQDGEGHAYWMIHYAFTPVHIHAEDGTPERYYRSIRLTGAPEQDKPDDPRTASCTPEEWLALLREGGYTHLFIYNANDELTRDFGQMFAEPEKIADGTLFSIRRQDAFPVFAYVANE